LSENPLCGWKLLVFFKEMLRRNTEKPFGASKLLRDTEKAIVFTVHVCLQTGDQICNLCMRYGSISLDSDKDQGVHPQQKNSEKRLLGKKLNH
jgi:hypothetical protein